MCKILSKVNIPIKRNGKIINSTFFSFQGNEEITQKEHFAIGLGSFENNPTPLVRLHSECMTGDVFFSKRCDCGEQLTESIDVISKQGRQEGRGIGLFNKIKAYRLQDEGYNTYEANHKLGFEGDLRNFDVAAEMLKALGAPKINLLTNNNTKRMKLQNANINVRSVIPTKVYLNKYNESYLKSKKEDGKHNLKF